MSHEIHLQADQRVGPYAPVRHTTATVMQPLPHHTDVQPAASLTLYQVPVPGAVQVQLPDGRIAWGRPVEHRLDPVPVPKAQGEPMPAWAKAMGMVAGSLSALALGSALALRIAAPALGGLVDVLDMLWKTALVLAVILFGGVAIVRGLVVKATGHASGTGTSGEAGQTVVFAPQIDTGGNRLIGRAGDVNIQWGNGNRNKH
ncbi:hypothetical protein [Streptomyces agglomeratus]|uniref:hypothetical protein n=1 Tax=Streptomyces agglomeratus TaxID=285458 RepID=UPI0008540E1B|nr:hypothetical protein [Streptomyces agglomeratus]OEJ36337.1 hypothetical protein BGK72_38925 [Streptomyces agglomeratus]